jgi:excisionase family DNA binding protein
MASKWVSVEEIAKYVGISKDTVYRYVHELGMPAHRVGRLLRFKKEEVDVWIRSGASNS